MGKPLPDGRGSVILTLIASQTVQQTKQDLGVTVAGRDDPHPRNVQPCTDRCPGHPHRGRDCVRVAFPPLACAGVLPRVGIVGVDENVNIRYERVYYLDIFFRNSSAPGPMPGLN